MSLRWRIALALAAIAAVVCAVAAAGAYVLTARQLEDAVDQSLLLRGPPKPGNHRDDRRPGRPGPGPDDGDTGCPQGDQLPQAAAAQLLAADGSATPCFSNGLSLPVDDGDRAIAATGQGPSRLRTVSIDGTSYRMITIPTEGGGALQVARSLGENDEVLSSLRLRLVALATTGALAAGAVGWLVARRIVRPVVRLRDAAEDIATTQDLTTPIPAGGPGEVGSLAGSLTTMVHALATSREQQRRLVADASHEMRTPLTSLRTNLELLDQHPEMPIDERTEIMESAQEDVGDLTALLTELVDLATDVGGDEAEPEPVSLVELAGEVAARAGRRWGRAITVAPGDDEPAIVVARRQALERAISNLIDNAAKYSPAGSPIEVTVAGGRLEVRDHGPGIDAADLPSVFDRFYRSTTARSEPGSGLGLAIVKQVVDRHGGRVWAGNAAGGGAVVGFELDRSS